MKDDHVSCSGSRSGLHNDVPAAVTAARRNPFNAWITVDESLVDQNQPSAAAPSSGLLAGMPCGVKDVIDVAGLPTTNGSKFPANTPTADAPVVQSLRQAGAIVIGKNATHEFAYGPTGDVAATGPTLNPVAPERMSGGSSNGSAAAVAAGDVPFSLGTDTGGSVRIPASLCGVVGLRPTVDALSAEGMFPVAPTLDTVGILAADVQTADRVWSAISGEATYVQDRSTDPRTMKVGVIVDDCVRKTSPDITAAIARTLMKLRELGVGTVDVTIGWMDSSLEVYRTLQGAEAAFVHRSGLAQSAELYQDEVLERLQAGAAVLGWQYLEALSLSRQWQEDIDRYFDDCDVLVCPTTPITAPKLKERKIADSGWETVREALLSFTTPWSLLGVPALAIPVGADSGGLPISMQIIGRPGAERSVLAVASLVEKVHNNTL